MSIAFPREKDENGQPTFDPYVPGVSYVIKRFDMRLVTGQTENPEYKEKLKQHLFDQGSTMKSLKHDNIVRVFQTLFENNIYHMLMQFCDGGTLEYYLDKRPRNDPLPEAQIRNWAAQLASAGNFLHQREILHRDIKSDNIFLTWEQTVLQLGDFGIDINTSNICPTTRGCWCHLAPEVVLYHEYGFESEVWSFGVVVYEMAKLTVPFPHATQHWVASALNRDMVDIPPIPEHYSDELRSLIFDKFLVREKEKRATMAELIELPYFQSDLAQLAVESEERARELQKLQDESDANKELVPKTKLQIVIHDNSPEKAEEDVSIGSLAKQLGFFMSVMGPKHYLNSSLVQRRGVRKVKLVMSTGNHSTASSSASSSGDSENVYDCLTEAVLRGDQERVKQLLDQLGGLNLANPYGRNLLLEAANLGYGKIVGLLISSNNRDNYLLDFD